MERNKNLSIDYVKINRFWVQCDNCESLLYIRFLRENKSVFEECGYYLQMNSSDRIEVPIDHDTRLQFHSENEPAHSDPLHYEDES
jgi:acetyl-CoA carboxylase beta subunit